MKFILSRTNDYEIHSKKWIVGYGLLFWIVSRIAVALLIMGCGAVYDAIGLNPENLTRFAGAPQVARNLGSAAYTLLTVSIIAPLLEECIFRLGLAFEKRQVVIAVASIPAYLFWQLFNQLTFASTLVFIFAIAGAFTLINCFTKDSFWAEQKLRHFDVYIWISAIAFGFIHLIAFSSYSPALLPYMMCVISVPFFAGCAITYYRINLGFWWGVGLHIFNNLPAVIYMIVI